MPSIASAYDALEARKGAVFGAEPASKLENPTDFQRRALISGFDVDFGDLVETAERFGKWASQMALLSGLPLEMSFATIWVDAFLTGLMFTTIKEDESDGPESHETREG